MDHGTFPVIDFQKDNVVVSLKTIDPRLSSYKGDEATKRIIEYLEKLNVGIIVGDELVERLLDVRVPKGTKNMLNMDDIKDTAKRLNIGYVIKEFNEKYYRNYM